MRVWHAFIIVFKWEVICTERVNLKKDNHKGKVLTSHIIFVEGKIPRVEIKPYLIG